MTRRELREHCFKMLFCQDFYPAEEKEEQLERYFEAPKEDVTGEDGKDEILHDPFEKEEDRAYLEKRVEKIMELIPEIDENMMRRSRRRLPSTKRLNSQRNSAEMKPRHL